MTKIQDMLGMSNSDHSQKAVDERSKRGWVLVKGIDSRVISHECDIQEEVL